MESATSIKGRVDLESHLLALEVAHSTTICRCAAPAASTPTVVEATSSSAASSTSTTIIEPTTASTSAPTVIEATSSSTASAPTRRITIVLARRAVVKTDGTASKLGTLKSTQRLTSFINRGELDVFEALELTGLHVSGQSDSLDLTIFAEEFFHALLVGAPGDIADEEGARFGTSLVTIVLSTRFGTIFVIGLTILGARLGEIDVQRAVINLSALLVFVRLCGIGSISEFDIPESVALLNLILSEEESLPSRTASLLVNHDSDASELAILLELPGKPLFIHIP
jgi:hypothetical protein